MKILISIPIFRFRVALVCFGALLSLSNASPSFAMQARADCQELGIELSVFSKPSSTPFEHIEKNLPWSSRGPSRIIFQYVGEPSNIKILTGNEGDFLIFRWNEQTYRLETRIQSVSNPMPPFRELDEKSALLFNDIELSEEGRVAIRSNSQRLTLQTRGRAIDYAQTQDTHYTETVPVSGGWSYNNWPSPSIERDFIHRSLFVLEQKAEDKPTLRRWTFKHILSRGQKPVLSDPLLINVDKVPGALRRISVGKMLVGLTESGTVFILNRDVKSSRFVLEEVSVPGEGEVSQIACKGTVVVIVKDGNLYVGDHQEIASSNKDVRLACRQVDLGKDTQVLAVDMNQDQTAVLVKKGDVHEVLLFARSRNSKMKQMPDQKFPRFWDGSTPEEVMDLPLSIRTTLERASDSKSQEEVETHD